MNDFEHSAYQAARTRQREKLARWQANHAGDKAKPFKTRTLMQGERNLGKFTGELMEIPEVYPEE